MLMTVGCGSPPKYNLPVDSPFLPYEAPDEVADQGADGDDDPEIPDGNGEDGEDDDDDTGAAAPPAAAGGNSPAK